MFCYRGWGLLLTIVCLAPTGCFPKETPPPGLDCSPILGDGTNPAATVSYDPDHMLCVKLSMAPEDFDALRNESRNMLDVMFASCDTPFESIFTWFHGDVELDGIKISDVGLRNKGFVGSMNSEKPSIKIKLDKFAVGRILGDTERITLNNNSGELSRVRTCLAYALFKQAGLPAPRCNLATVVVNGEPEGVYSHVEPMKKRFLRAAFGNDNGSLYEGTLTDFRQDWLERFEPKTGDSDTNRMRLRAIAQALETEDDSAFLEQLRSLINIDAFITFWAMELILGHTDGYTANLNNYFVYFDPEDHHRGYFLPWSMDMTLSNEGPGDQGIEAYTRAALPARFSRMPGMNARFEAEVNRLLEEVWDRRWLLGQVDRLGVLVPLGQDDPDYGEHLEELRENIRKRPEEVRDLLNKGLPPRLEESDSCAPFAG